MKYLITILFIIASIQFILAQDESTQVWRSKDPKGMKFIPPGTFDYDLGSGKKATTIQGFWISNEITNKEFREFYEDIKANPDSSFSWYDVNNKNEDGSSKIVSVKYSEIIDELIDNTVWANVPGYENYFTSKVFDNFPVTGVSYQSAQYFCWWKSKRENLKNKEKGYLTEYRLPTKAEWVYSAYTGSDEKQLVALASGKPQKIKSGLPVRFGLYNMFDNAAEFVRDDNQDQALIVTFSWEKAGEQNIYTKVTKDYRDKITGFRIVRTFIGRKLVEARP